MSVRDFPAELKVAQAAVKALGTKRDQLVGDARFEESRVATATEQLVALGIDNAATLTVDELLTLKETTQAEMEANLTALQANIVTGQELMREYESAAK